MDQKYLVMDYESRSRADIKEVGAYEYSLHESTRILCVAWALGTAKELKTAKIKSWTPANYETSFPQEFYDALKNPEIKLVAHNAYFEQVITKNVAHVLFAKHFNIPPSRWICTAARAAALALPRNLENACIALKLPVQKDMDGRRLMLKMSKPRKPTKNNPSIWHEKSEDLKRLMEYCEQDVRAEIALFLATPPLIPIEQKIWELDQKINFRGVNTDLELVDKTLAFIKTETENLNAETKEITGGEIESTTQRAATLNIIRKEIPGLPDLRAKTVADILSTSDNLSPAIRLLQIRQSISKTSTAKYEAFKSRAGSDGRVRDLLLYHAASTGRWGGMGIQPQNFPRGSIKDTDFSSQIVKSESLEFIRILYGNPMDVFSSNLRSVIIPGERKEFFCADYAAIEARVLFWVAGHELGVKAFEENKDLYKEMAAVIYNKQAKDVTKDERQLGKKSILGCFTGETLILTDSGWAPIKYLDPDCKIWDGMEWVEHGGLKYQGEKSIIHYRGIGVTPEHLLLTPSGWAPASRAVKERYQFRKSMTDLAHCECADIPSALAAELLIYKYLARVIGKTFLELTRITFLKEAQRGVIHAQKKSQREHENYGGDTPPYARIISIARGFSTAYQLYFKDVIIKKVGTFATMVKGALRYTRLGKMIALFSLNISCHFRGGICQILSLTEKMLTGITPPEIYDLLRGKSTCLTDDKSATCKQKLPNSGGLYSVYDILNCGPRNRFTILTADGPILAHNCGYGMGPTKFYENCIGDGIRISEDMAKMAISAYRETHYPIPRLWKSLEQAAIAAVNNPGKKYTVNKTTWFVYKNFLWCELPSGRRLAYYGPEIRYKATPWGEKRETLYHWEANSVTKQWECNGNYGGKLTENVVQAIARDFMAAAMLRIEDAGYEIVLSVHDELLAERKIGEGNLKEFEDLMSTKEKWGEGCPIKVEGYTSFRYRK